MDKKQQERLEQRRRQEDAVFNRLLIAFGGALAFEALVLFVNRFLVNYGATNVAEIRFALVLSKILMVLQFVAPALTVAAGAWYLLRRRREGVSAFLPRACFWAGAALTVTAIVGYNYRTAGMTLLCALPIAIAVLSLIYYLYQREFFFSALICGCGIATLWLYRKAYEGFPRTMGIILAAAALLLAAAAVVTWKMSRGDGSWGKYRLLPEGAGYLTLWLTIGFTALALVLAVLVGATAAYYAMFALAVWLFCMAVYYTVRMM